LLVFSRPEAMLFALLFAAAAWAGSRRDGTRGRDLLVLPVAAALSLLALNVALTGHLAPASGRPKSPLFAPYFSLATVLEQSVDFLLFAVKGLLSGLTATPVRGSRVASDVLVFAPPFAL